MSAESIPRPRVSVIVPTRDREQYLGRCLASLLGQTLGGTDYEIVVVDDGSSAPVEGSLGGAIEGARTAVRFLRLETSVGPAQARNAALAIARGKVLAFTDDDCRPDPRWLEAGESALERGFDFVAGRTIPEPEERAGAGAFDYTMDVPGPDVRYSTCNIFYRREVVENAGGFSDAFVSSAGHHYAEDTDLAWRAIEAGARAGYDGDLVVFHAVRPRRFMDHLKSRRRLEMLVPLVKRYPGVKAAHFSKHVYSKTHAFLYLALLAIGLFFVTPWALLLAAPYFVWRSREKRSLATRPWRFVARNRALPLWLVADVYECWIVARASFRHGHLYL